MKQWVQKLVDQLDLDWGGSHHEKSKAKVKISEDRATILYIIDTLNKNLIELDSHPVRKVRETLDSFAKEIVNSQISPKESDDILFRFRQFFSAYRVAEYAYLQKTFEDFKGIIWNFVEQLAEDSRLEQAEDKEMHHSFQQLKEAVEANSIPMLRAKSREFIDFYIEHQTKRDTRRSKRIKGIKKNLDLVKKQLVEADRGMRVDHLTQAFNRRSFDEHMKQQISMHSLSKAPVSMLLMDIDFFKKINDSYGHDVGDFVLKECVRTLQEMFHRENDFVARIGGEEFAVILPDHAVEHAVKRAEQVLARVRKEVFVKENMELRFTVSIGVAQLLDGESADQWVKRADGALYQSKNSGRNRYTVAEHPGLLTQVA